MGHEGSIASPNIVWNPFHGKMSHDVKRTQEHILYFPIVYNSLVLPSKLCIKFCCLHFASRVVNRKEINPANLKHKMNIFVLVGLDILLLLESDHFTEKRLVSR